MALVKYGGGIIQQSGSMAGNTYARNRFGNYVRARTKPVNPNTSGQQACRSAIAYLTQYWKDTLTAAQRTAWETYAAAITMQNKLGEAVNLTGFNHFVRSNSWLQRAGKTLVAAGPTVLALPVHDSTFAITASAGGGTISVTFDNTLDWANEDDAYLVTWQGVPQSATRNYFNGPWNELDNIEGDSVTAPTSPDSQTAVYTLVQNQKIWVYARIVRADGRMSTPFTASCTVAA